MKKRQKTRAETLLELLDDPDTRWMIEHTDKYGGHLFEKTKNKRCTI